MVTRNSIDTSGSGIVQVVTSTLANDLDVTVTMPGISSATLPGYFLSSDVIPQQTDGTEIVTATITPLYATSNLLIEYVGTANYQGTYSWVSICSLFKDSGANALATTCGTCGYYNQNIIRYLEASGSTTARTYKIRVGPSLAGGSVSINGTTPSYSIFPGINLSRINIYEVLV